MESIDKQRINNIIVILVLFMLSLFLFGCGEKKEAQTKRSTEEIEQSFKNIQRLGRADKFILLSMKYGIEISKLKNIIEEYTEAVDKIKKQQRHEKLRLILQREKNYDKPIEESIKGSINQIKAIVDDLVKKYKIPESKFASIIIDFNVMTDCEKATKE